MISLVLVLVLVLVVGVATILGVIFLGSLGRRDSLFGGISLYGNVSDTYISQNRVRGTGAFALQTSTPAGRAQRSNTFVGNSIAPFESDTADVFLDQPTEDTVLAGFGGTVIDLGTNNRITGFTRLTPGAGIGQQISEAQRRREQIEAMESPPPRRATEP